MSQTELANVNLTDAELIEKIKSKLGGKELSDGITNQIIDVNHQVKTSRQKVQDLYRYSIEVEKLSKEETKTIVAELLHISLRTTELYIPDDLKDKKYVSDHAKRASSNRQLKQDTDTSSPGTYNEEGKYGTAQEIEMSEPEQTPSESLESQLKRLSKTFKEDVEITVLGRTFKVTIKVDPVARTVEPIYNEKELARILKSRP